MVFEDFSKLLNDVIARTQNVLAKKNKEYSDGADKLYNFKRAAAALGCSPERALLGMQIKHIVSLFDIVDKIDKDGTCPTIPLLEEKLTDTNNYNILLEALIKERIANGK